MPQQHRPGDAGSTRRPRGMDEQRRAAWNAALKKLDAGLAVPTEAHEALLHPGLFEGLDAVAAQEEAACVVRYWLHGFDWLPIPPRGPAIAAQWPFIESTHGVHRADEALRNYIQASRHDPDYRAALDCIAVWHHDQVLPFPAPLAKWAIQCHRGKLPTLPKPRGDQGRPAYAQANRNLAMAAVFHLLGYLGLHGKVVRYHVIGAEFECSEDTVRKAPCDPCPLLDGRVSPAVGMLAGAHAHRPSPALAASQLDTIRRIASSDLGRFCGMMRSSTPHIPWRWLCPRRRSRIVPRRPSPRGPAMPAPIPRSRSDRSPPASGSSASPCRC